METGFLNHNKATRFTSPAKSARQVPYLCARIIFLLAFSTSVAYADPPVADDQGVTMDEDDPPIGIVLTTSHPDGGLLDFNIEDLPSNGSLGGTAPNVTYTPIANFNGSDSFTFTIDHGVDPSNVATVSITVDPVDDGPPVANSQGVTTNEDDPIGIVLTGSDPDGGPLTFNLGSGPSNGSLSGAAPNVTYTPDTDFNGSDNFTFTVNASGQTSNVATVSITVDPLDDGPPVANSQGVTTDEDAPVAIVLTGSDPDGRPLTFNLGGGPSNGSLSGATPNVTYTPAANFNGSDSFTFTITAGGQTSNVATVSITVDPVNDGVPTAMNDGPGGLYTAPEGGSVSGSPNVLDNDSDPDDDPMTAVLVSRPANEASFSLRANGTFTYVHDGSETTSDSFTYRANDGFGSSNIATVSITITPANDPPIADDQVGGNSVNTNEDVAVAIVLTGSDADGDSLTFAIVSGPSDGTLGPLSGDTVTYTPDQDFNGTDSFRFRVNDGTTNSNIATVRIVVASVNDPPEVVTPIPDQTFEEDEFKRVDVSGNFRDVDDDLRFSAAGLPDSLSIGSNSGVISGTPTQAEAEFNGGVYNVTVFATDDEAPAAESSFVLRVLPVNDAPVANNQDTSTDEDSSVSITLTGSDVDGDDLTFIVNDPPNGSISGTAPNVTYTPDPNFNGSDSFTFRVNDGFVNSNIATVSIDVRSINDRPILDQGIADKQAVEGTPFNFDVSGNFSDVDSNLTFTANGLPPSGNINFSNSGRFSGTPQVEDTDFFEGNSGIYSITVTATERAGEGEDEKVSDVFRLTIAALDRANISLQIGAAPTPALLEDEVQFNFSVNNMGPQGGADIDLTGSFIGQGLTVTPSGATTCTVQSPRNDETDFSCMIGDLAIGATMSLTITASTGSPGVITVAATAEGGAAVPIDPDPANNAVQHAVGIAEKFSIGAVQILGNSQILSVAAGDLNNDNATDLVIGTSAGQPVQIFLSGGFRDFNSSPLTIGDNSAHRGVALADFDGNGFLDVVLANADGPDTVYSNNGDNTFTLMATLSGQTVSNAVAVADFDRDGNMDIVLAVTGENLVYLGNGSGGFTLRDTLGSADSRDVAVGLIDGNGRPDIIFANVGSSSSLWTGTNSANFSAKQTMSIGDATSVVVAELIGGSNSNALDVAFGRIPNGVGDVPENLVMSNNGSGNLSVSRRLGTAPTSDILAGDVNRDGQTDLVFVNDTGVHQIWIRSGSDFELYGEQIYADGATAGVVTELGMIDVDDPGGTDLAMGGVPVPGAGVFLNDGLGNLGRGDAIAPELTLLGDDPFNVPAGSSFVDPGVTATDNIDGDVRSSVVATGNVNSAVIGTYIVTYDVMDFAGNNATPVTRSVIITVAAGTGGGGGGAIAPLTVLFALGVFVAALWRRHKYIRGVTNDKSL